MRRTASLLFLGILCSACQTSMSAAIDEEVVSSIRYDDIDCADLARQRDQLAASHGLPKNVERQPRGQAVAPGFGVFVPDMRSPQGRARAKAVGEITAMNQSMERRECGQAA